MTTITYHATDDGYLLGADSHEVAANNYRFWHPAGCEFDNCTIETVELFAASESDIRGYEAMGTSEQEWSDGYQAMDSLRLHIIR